MYLARKSAGKSAGNTQFERGKSPFFIFLKTCQISKKSLLDQKLQNEQDLAKTCQPKKFEMGPASIWLANRLENWSKMPSLREVKVPFLYF